MTEKLYEQDAFLIKFEAKVLSCEKGKKGFDFVLDRTAFYPEGGGQPWDTGRLETAGTRDKVKVLEVHLREGEIVHTCNYPLEPETVVTGVIDWDRRFDLMQQHSGEHIVSGLAHSLWGCENVGFHMGAEVITIDLSLPLNQNQLTMLEAEVNKYIYLDLPVDIAYPSREELEHIRYRSKKELAGQVRIVTFPGADCCACCGTHVRSAGQVGLVKLLTMQKFREGVRIELVCGSRALRYLSQTMEQNTKVSQLLSAKVFETGAAVERLLGENEALKARLLALEEARFAQLARQYAGQRDVLLFENGLSPDSLRRLSDTVLHSYGGGLCACFSGDDSSGYKYAIGQPNGLLRGWVKELNKALNGRGGGRDDFVQGSVQASRSEIEAFFTE